MEVGATPNPINLLNFDAKEHRECRYILTSPRSLRACANLKIKPVELLPQTLEEFSCSRASQGLHGSVLVAVHEELEKQKRVKLQKACKEREQIITEEEQERVALVTPAADKSEWSSKGRESSHYQRITSQGGVMDTSNISSLPINSLLPEKDQRILRALVMKGESRESQIAIQLEAERARDKEQHDMKLKREALLKGHQKHLANCRRDFEKRLVSLRKARLSQDVAERDKQLAHQQAKHEKWRRQAEEQAWAQSQQKAAQQEKRETRKKQQEIKLRELQAQEAELRQFLEEGLRDQQYRASENRELTHSRRVDEIKYRSSAEHERFKMSKQELELHKKLQEEALESSLAMKERETAERLHRQQDLREQEIRHSAERRKQRAIQREKACNQLTEELHDWQDRTDQCWENNMTRATEKYKQEMSKRVQRLQQSAKERKEKHKEALSIRLQEEEEKRVLIAQEMDTKRLRVEEIEQYHQEMLNKLRKTAELSAKLRETVKKQYMRNSFQKLAREAEVYASLEKKGTSNSNQRTHSSKVVIG